MMLKLQKIRPNKRNKKQRKVQNNQQRRNSKSRLKK